MDAVEKFTIEQLAKGKNTREIIVDGSRKKFRASEILAVLQRQIAKKHVIKSTNDMEEDDLSSDEEEVVVEEEDDEAAVQAEATAMDQETKCTTAPSYMDETVGEAVGGNNDDLEDNDRWEDGEGDAGWEDEEGDEGWEDEDGGGGWDEDKLEEMGPPELTRTSSFKIYQTSEVETKQASLISKVCELLYVSNDTAESLLRHYRWDDGKLKKEWFEDQKKVKQEVGISTVSDSERTSSSHEMIQCLTWGCGRVPKRKAHALACGHYFCKGCWRDFLESEIAKGRTCIFSRCPAMRCTKQHVHKFGCACQELVPSSTFKKYIKKQDLLEKYKYWNLQSFVEGQEGLKWCPNPKCTRIVEYKQGGEKTIGCQCGNRFCFSCLKNEHEPAPCDLVQKWMESTAVKDDATELWLKARTKKCPKCGVRIEKNRACNHMTCAKCNHHFCWLCKGPWSEHGTSTGGYYVCKKYNEELKKGTRSNEEKDMITTQQLLQKYNYYVGRFTDARNGVELTKKLERKMEQQFVRQNRSVEHTKFITEATTSLAYARTCMQWCYVLDFYLVASKEKKLFEFQQELLIGHTENLQDMIETNGVDDLLQKKKDILSKTTTLNNLRRRMITIVNEGNFEAVLSYKGDAKSEHWQCLFCETQNRTCYTFCKSCQACKLHGEPDCRACSAGRRT